MTLIQTEEESIRKSIGRYSCQLFGKIYIRTPAGDCFPDENWDDFLLIVLGWWLQSALQLLNDDESLESFTFRFMDGPYSFTARREGQNLAIGFRIGEKEEDLLSYPLRDFIKSLLRASNSVIRVSEEIGFISADLDKLRELQSELHRVAA